MIRTSIWNENSSIKSINLVYVFKNYNKKFKILGSKIFSIS